jgi:hypothetical protein
MAWTIKTLHRHLSLLIAESDRRYEERFKATEKLTDQAMDSAKEAVVKAELATEKRFDNANEWRDAMTDRDKLYVPREAFDAQANALSQKVQSLELRLEKQEGRTIGGKETSQRMIAIVGAILALLEIVNIIVNMRK